MAGNSSPGDSRKLYQNWIKGGLGLRIVKEGIGPYVTDEIQNQHQDILKGLPLVRCTACVIRNLQPDHTFKKEGNVKKCPLGMKKCICLGKNQIPCPNNLCGKIHDRIVQSHRFQDPNWSNTDISKWSTDYWEVAKCYINSSGYGDKASANETDCSGLLSIIINNFIFPFSISTTAPLDDFSRMRNTRNEIMHQPNLEINDADLQKYLNDMETLLKLVHYPTAASVVDKIKTLQSSVIVSAEDEKSLRLETLKELEREKKIAIQDIQNKKKDINELGDQYLHDIKQESSSAKSFITRGSDEFQCKRDQAFQDLDHEKSQAVNEIGSARDKVLDKMSEREDAALSAIDKNAEQKMEQLKEYENETKLRLQNVETSLEQERKNIEILSERTEAVEKEHQNFKDATETLTNDIEKLKKNVDDIDQTIKKHRDRLTSDICKVLCEYYAQNFFHVYITSVIKRPVGNIDDVMIEMKEAEPAFMEELVQRKISQYHRYSDLYNLDTVLKEQPSICASSFKSIFTRKQNLYKNIVITGNMGTGKTTWCLNLLHKWVIAKERERNSDCTFKEDASERENDMDGLDDERENELFLQTFDIVLYIPLSGHSQYETIPELIRNNTESPFYQDDDTFCKVEEILRSNEYRCLVVLDDLHEVNADEPIRIPYKLGMDNCFFVATSLANTHIPPYFEVDEFDRFLSIKCVENIRTLHAAFITKFLRIQKQKDINEVNNEAQIGKVLIESTHLVNRDFKSFLGKDIPAFIVFLLLSWYKRGQVERTRALNYAAAFDYVIHLAEDDKTGILREAKNYESITKQFSARLPECFDPFSKLNKYAGLIVKLAKNVFQTTFEYGKKDLTSEEGYFLFKMGLLMKQDDQIKGHECSVDSFLSALYLVVYTRKHDEELIQRFQAHCDTYGKLKDKEDILFFTSGIDPEIGSQLSNKLYPTIKHGEEINRLFQNPLETCKEEMACFFDSYPSVQHPIHTTKIRLSDVQMKTSWECNYQKVTEVHLNSEEIHEFVIGYLRMSKNVRLIYWSIPSANFEAYQLKSVTDVFSSLRFLTVLILSGCGSTFTPNCSKTQDIDLAGCAHIKHISFEKLSCRNIFLNTDNLVTISVDDICQCALIAHNSKHHDAYEEKTQVIYERCQALDTQNPTNECKETTTVDVKTSTDDFHSEMKSKSLSIPDETKATNNSKSENEAKGEKLNYNPGLNSDVEVRSSKTPNPLRHIFCKYMKQCKLEISDGPEKLSTVSLKDCRKCDILIRLPHQENDGPHEKRYDVCFNKSVEILDCMHTRLLYHIERVPNDVEAKPEVAIDSLRYERNINSGIFCSTKYNANEVKLRGLYNDADGEIEEHKEDLNEMRVPKIETSVDIAGIPNLNSSELLRLLGKMTNLKRLDCKNFHARHWEIIGAVLPEISKLELLSVENNKDIPSSFMTNITRLTKLSNFEVKGNCQGTPNENRVTNKRKTGIKGLATRLPSLKVVECMDILNLEIWPKVSLSYLSNAAPVIRTVQFLLKSDDDVEVMCSILISLSKLERLHLDCVSGVDVEAIFMHLSQLTNLKHFSCSGISFDEFFPENVSVLDLSCLESFKVDCTDSWSDAPNIINYLPHMVNVTNLSIQAFLSETSWVQLASLLPNLTSLKTVEIGSLPRHFMPVVVLESLTLVKGLRKLTLIFQLMSNEELSPAISKLVQLETFEIIYQSLFEHSEMTGLLNAISKLVNLRELAIIVHRQRNPKMYTELAGILPNLTNLEKLALAENVRTPSVLLSLQHLKNLRWLYLPGLKHSEWLSLGQSLPFLSKLENLEISPKGPVPPAPKYVRKSLATGAVSFTGNDDELSTTA